MKRTASILIVLTALVTSASVPIRWTVETSRANPVQFDAYHGETLELSAAFKSYGNDLSAAAPAALHYQTNGMGSSWWTAPATCASNTISATFTPDLDPGAGGLNCFLGGTASTYRAAFRLRFLNSPGATPNVLALPVTSYDARLYGTPTVNGTNLTEWVHARSQEETDPLAYGIATNVVTNVVTKSYVEALGITGGSGGGIDTNAVKDIINAETGGTNTLTHGGLTAIPSELVVPVQGYDYGGSVTVKGSMGRATLTVEAGASNGGTITVEDAVNAGNQAEVTIGTMPVRATVDALSTTQSTDHATISAWQTYWDGDDVRLTVTNYYGSSGFPHLYLEEKMATNETHTSTWFKVVWDEMTRWTNFTAGYSTFTNNAIQNYADRAWGAYDSSTGEYSPEGVLQVSQPNILIAAGLAYQKTVTANGGAVWVLTATDPTLVGGQTENGFLNITDGDGNSLMKIVKGDRRTVGATATAIDVQSGAVKVAYSCVADEHPILQAATNLTETFSTEAGGTISVGGQSATVAWTGTSGAYTGTVTFASMPSSAFFRATYETGGETYISNSAPISVSSGILCTDGIHKCRPVYSNGSITWEVVQ